MKKYVEEQTLENAYMQVLDIIENVGIRFESTEVRDFFQQRGAKICGENVLIPRNMMEEAISATPKQDYGEITEKRVVAATPFCNAPFVIDDHTGKISRCKLEDEIKMYQINETSPLYESANPGFADPEDIDVDDSFIAQIAMTLKYSNKYPSIGLRATGSNAKDGNVYKSARKGFRLVREFYDIWDEPVMTQGICPNPPLAYDRESLDNLKAAIDEKQAISLFPCSVSFMTGPERILDLVVHDFALALAGLCYIQLLSPGHPVSLSEFSTISDIRTLQPVYGTPESIIIQVIFYEISKYLKLPCVICGSYSDAIMADYQSGAETMLTMMLPFQLTEIDEVWCYPGHMSGFSCGSFQKAILDEESMRYVNRALRKTDCTIHESLPKQLIAAQDEGSFLSIGSMTTYREDHYLTELFNKTGVAKAKSSDENTLRETVDRIIRQRINSYELPQHTESQKKLLQPYLPTICRY
ncbi:MAG TPA: trimethylamine methyltransferase family protein [Clostridiales bacterium]|nr:trimethylamine methyltransferase family protein [Clostridiales bacterium]